MMFETVKPKGKTKARAKGKPAPDVVLTGDDIAKSIAMTEAKLPRKGDRFTGNMVDEPTAEAFLNRMADGRSMRSICRDSDMPSTETVRAWLARSPSFTARYVRAREQQADAIFDEALHLADSVALDPELTHEKLGAVRLQIDTRKWIAGKLRPSKYSDKHMVEMSGPDGGPIQMRGFDLDAIDRDQRDTLADTLRLIGAASGDIEDI